MKSLTTHQKILTLLKNLHDTNDKLSTFQLLSVLEQVKQLCHDKTTVSIMIKCINSLLEKPIPKKEKLTDRESQVTLLIAKGLPNDIIAQRLNLSKSTIETHRKNIRKKLNLKGNDSLFAFALVFSLQCNYHH